MYKHLFYLSFALGILVPLVASDTSNKQFSLKECMAKKHTIPAYGYDHASSKSFFALDPVHGDKIVIYDRRKQYGKYDECPVQGNAERGCSVTIVADSHVVQGQNYEHGLWVAPIGDAQKIKNIKLPKYNDSIIAAYRNGIGSLQDMPQADNQILFRTSFEGVFILDLIAEKVIHNFKAKKRVIGNDVIPCRSGKGFWYATPNDDLLKSYTVSYYDTRSGNSTQSIEVPSYISNLSVSPQSKYFAITNLTNQLLVFDIATRKREPVLVESTDYNIYTSFFINDDTLIYNMGKKQNDGYNHDHIKSFSLSSCNSETHELFNSINGFTYHYNTGLFVGYNYPSSLEVCETGTR